MRHRLSGLSTYGLNGRCLGDEHLAYAPLGYGPFTFFYLAPLGGLAPHMYRNTGLQMYYFEKFGGLGKIWRGLCPPALA